ncbi:MAG: hypothetical protein MUE69_03710 [Myxococcota bacterium]|nr:hypothetical protein [Myxococcota bacterium]
MIATSHSRTHVARDHALITPESHVPASMPGWVGAKAITLIAPVMGAGFVQCLVTMQPDSRSALPLPGRSGSRATRSCPRAKSTRS